jgi:hypothetical protein
MSLLVLKIGAKERQDATQSAKDDVGSENG